MANVNNQPPAPKLTLLDITNAQGDSVNLPTEIVFQFEALGLVENVASSWASSTGLNRSHPILQFSNGEQESFNFEARFWAAHSQATIEAMVDALKAACRRDEDLKRPPRWQFTWGTFIDETVVVKSVGNIRYDQVRSDGSLRGCTMAIELLVYKSIDVALTTDERPGDTFFAVTKLGDEWEDIAMREYDDPLLGELLRRRNPALTAPGEQPGKIVKLPKPETLRNQPVEPDSGPLRRTSEGLALRSQTFESRGQPRESTIVLKD